MTKIMKGGIAYNATSNMVALTQAEYDSLSTAQKNNGNFYFITDADPSYFSAENIDYDNTSSGLTATDVQSGIDEVVTKLADKAGVLKFPNGSSIRGALVDTSIKSGLYVANTMSASDNPAGAYVSFTLISKPRDDGAFSTVYAFVQGHLYSCLIGSSVPSSLSFTLLV